jgi:AsmA protein
MKLDAPALPVEEVGSLLPALGVTLPKGCSLEDGSLSAAFGISGPTDKLVIDGSVKLQNTRLDGFDLGSKLSALSAFSGKAAPSKDTTIQNASANARMAPEGTRVDSINVTVPAIGTLTGAGTVSPAGALNFNMVAELSGGGRDTQRASRREDRGGGIPFAIQGTTSDPKFVPDIKGMAAGAVQEKISPKGQSTTKGLLRKIPR